MEIARPSCARGGLVCMRAKRRRPSAVLIPVFIRVTIRLARQTLLAIVPNFFFSFNKTQGFGERTYTHLEGKCSTMTSEMDHALPRLGI